MIRSDFHIHTTFADGKNTAEETVLSAIEKGLTVVGISEHSETPFDPSGGMKLGLEREYIAEIKRLREKYADKIRILCGIEADFDTDFLRDEYDYIIGSVHYLTVGGELYMLDYSPAETMRCINDAFGGDPLLYAKAYYEKLSGVCEKTGADIVGHIDIITKFCERGIELHTDSAEYLSYVKNAVSDIIRANEKIAFEINTGAIARGHRTRPYPTADVLSIIKNSGANVVINSDSHTADGIVSNFDMAKELAASQGIKNGGFFLQSKEYIEQF